jgi:predicted TIM-barrel fold metal-dependent hydrolase
MYIDAHCHLFHKGYLTRRILKELAQLTTDLDRWIHRERKNADYAERHKIGLKSLLQRTHNVLRLILSESSHEVLRRLQRHYWPERYIFVPLSYDLISCFQEEYEQDLTKLALYKHDKQLLQDFRYQIKLFISKYFGYLRRYDFFRDLLDLYFKLEDLPGQPPEQKPMHIYLRQIQELTQLKQRYPHLIYPFFYYDPRREDLFELLKQNTGKDKYFAGVKLYTPNGYSPLDPNLLKVYEFCERNDIPITVHNAYGGFSNFVRRLEVRGAIFKDGQVVEHNGWIDFQYDFFAKPELAIKERSMVLNHPLLWQKVLDMFPELRLNLAHFGGDSIKWQKLIAQMILSGKYPNLYTDLSCQTEEAMLGYIKKVYFTSPQLRRKFLYGSDFYLNMFFIDTFKEYYANFLRIFRSDEFEQIARINPKKFLWPEEENFIS